MNFRIKANNFGKWILTMLCVRLPHTTALIGAEFFPLFRRVVGEVLILSSDGILVLGNRRNKTGYLKRVTWLKMSNYILAFCLKFLFC
jgi:hypothetical protein